MPGATTHSQTNTLRLPGDPIDKTRIQSNLGTLPPGPKPNEISSSATGTIAVSSDLWSAAYSEAVSSFGKDLDVAMLQGKNVEQLFKQLEDLDKDSTQQPAFQRGVGYLRSIQVPLERFKLALDLTSPLATGLGPTTSVVGAVRSVTAVGHVFELGGLPSDTSTNSCLRRLRSLLRQLIGSLLGKSEKCLNKFPILMIATHSASSQISKIYTRLVIYIGWLAFFIY